MYIYYIPLVAWCISLVLFFLPHDEVACRTMPRCCEDWPFFVYPEESEEFTCEISRKITSTRNKHIWANYSGWWYTYHLEKWWSSSMGRMTSHIYPYIMENRKCLKPPTSNGFWCCKAPNMGWFSSIVFCKFWDWPGWSAAGAVMGAKKSGSCGYANIYAAHGLEIGASPHFYLP